MKRTYSVFANPAIVFAIAFVFAFTINTARAEAPKAEALKAEAPKTEAPKAQAPKIERIDILDFGIYTAREVDTSKELPDDRIRPPRKFKLAKMTREIPAQMGLRFGFRYVVMGKPDCARVALKKVEIFPPGGMKAPGTTRAITRWEHNITVKLGEANGQYSGYRFENPWELLPGVWTIEVWDGDRKLASQSFTVVNPKNKP